MKALDKLEQLRGECAREGRLNTAADLSDVIAELRPYFTPEVPHDSHFHAWVRIANALSDVHPGWRDSVTGPSAVDSAVAAIRSMAAQCSAQPTPRPETPRVTDYDLETIAAAIGVLYANDPVDDPIKLRLVDLFKSMRTNAPQE